MDKKNIEYILKVYVNRIRGYLRIKLETGRKQILKMNTRYLRVRVFLISAC